MEVLHSGLQQQQAECENLLPRLPVDLVVANSFVELLDVLGQLLSLFHQEVNIYLVPQGGVPVCEGKHDSAHHVPQRLQVP